MRRDERNASRIEQRRRARDAALRIDRIMQERAMQGDRAFAEELERKLRGSRAAKGTAEPSLTAWPARRP